MYPFRYRRAGGVEEARRLFEAGEDARYLAGGHTLLPAMKLRLSAPSDLIDIAGIAGLGRIRAADDAIVIGALARHNQVAQAREVRDAIPALAELAGGIGDFQVRNRGTIGGSIANADPAADYPAALLALGATVTTDRRRIAGDDFFTDLFETALDEGEIVTEIAFPRPRRAAYMKFPNPASRYAIVGVFVAQGITRGADGVRVAVTGAGPAVFRVGEMEAALAGDFTPEAIAGIAIPEDDLASDLHATPDYRAHLVTVMAKRAVARALARGPM